MSDWRVAAKTALTEGPVALITVLATEGSAPRGPGARMVVTPDCTHGTIGGGKLEYRAVEQARAIIDYPPGAWRVQDWPLGPLLGQCCGGRVRLLVEHLDDSSWLDTITVLATLHRDRIARAPLFGVSPPPVVARGPLPESGMTYSEPSDGPRLPLMLFGAGHVGRAIAERLTDLPFELAWFDCRPDYDIPGVSVQDEDALVACTKGAPLGSAVLILTHDHQLDYRLTAGALRSPAQFVGLIGSSTKRARFRSRLAADGIDYGRLTCPIGVAGVIGKDPPIIAIAVIAQLLTLAVPEAHSPIHKGVSA